MKTSSQYPYTVHIVRDLKKRGKPHRIEGTYRNVSDITLSSPAGLITLNANRRSRGRTGGRPDELVHVQYRVKDDKPGHSAPLMALTNYFNGKSHYHSRELLTPDRKVATQCNDFEGGHVTQESRFEHPSHGPYPIGRPVTRRLSSKPRNIREKLIALWQIKSKDLQKWLAQPKTEWPSEAPQEPTATEIYGNLANPVTIPKNYDPNNSRTFRFRDVRTGKLETQFIPLGQSVLIHTSHPRKQQGPSEFKARKQGVLSQAASDRIFNTPGITEIEVTGTVRRNNGQWNSSVGKKGNAVQDMLIRKKRILGLVLEEKTEARISPITGEEEWKRPVYSIVNLPAKHPVAKLASLVLNRLTGLAYTLIS